MNTERPESTRVDGRPLRSNALLSDLPHGMCCSCRWWKPERISSESSSADEIDARTKDWTTGGECHKHAPRRLSMDGPTIETHQADKDAIAWCAKWPETWGDGFCGDWERGVCPWFHVR